MLFVFLCYNSCIMYDTIIIGGGPAGMSATIYLARQKFKVLLLSGEDGGQITKSSDIENYLGFHLLSGLDLFMKFNDHLKDYTDKIDKKSGEFVKEIQRIKDGFKVITDYNEYESKTLLLASGTKHRELGVPGEKEMYGHGLTYCATCDAPLFKDKNVHVIGGGNSAMEAALFLAKYAKSIRVLVWGGELQGDALLIEKCKKEEKIFLVYQAHTVAITGNKILNGVTYSDSSGQEIHESSEGVFVEIGLVPASQYIDWVTKNKKGEIVVDKFNRTSIDGIWAAGDVTDVTEKQISVAVGEGTKAALDVIRYLSSL